MLCAIGVPVASVGRGEVGMDDVEHVLGIGGPGTIYRRFANKDALVAALVNRLLADVVAVGERLLADPDGTGMVNYMVEVCELLATSRGAVARLWSDPSSTDLVTRSRQVQQQLVDEAKRHGAAHEDLAGEDLAVALWAIHGILDVTRGQTVNAWRRHLDFVLAGFTDRPVDTQRPPLTSRRMTQIIRSSPLARVHQASRAKSMIAGKSTPRRVP